MGKSAATHQRYNGICGIVMAVLCIFTTFFLLPGLLSLTNDLDTLKHTISPFMKEGASLADKMERIVHPKVERALVPVNKTWMACGEALNTIETKIRATRAEIFDQAKLYAAAQKITDATYQAGNKSAIVKQTEVLYGALDTHAKTLGTQLAPTEGLRVLLKDFGAEDTIKKFEAVLNIVSGMYHSVQGIYAFASRMSKGLGHPIKVIQFPDLHLADISKKLKRIENDLTEFEQSVDKIVLDITGEIPDGLFATSAVTTRLEDIARNIKDDSKVDSPEMAATVAFAAFHRNLAMANEHITAGYYVLGNASIALSGIKNATKSGDAVMDIMALQFAHADRLPGLLRNLIIGQTCFCVIAAVWMIFYTFAKKRLGKCAFPLYVIFHIVMQVFFALCIAELFLIVIVSLTYYALSTGPCQGTFLTVAKYQPFCANHVFPTEKSLPVSITAACLTIFFAMHMLSAYHGMLADHLPGEGDKKSKRKLIDPQE